MRVIGAAFNSAGLDNGVAGAPRALRDAGLMARSDLHDGGDVDVGVLRPKRQAHSGLLALGSLQTMTASLGRAVAESLRNSQVPLVIGGDCPVLIGALRGANDVVGKVGLLFVDGHEDAWPPAVSTTGEAADCELGFLLGMNRGALPLMLTELTPSLDLREVEHWWLHVDLDVLSTEALPAVDYPQAGGLSWTQLESLTAAALSAPGCLGISVCIYNPDLDPGRHHAARIVDVVGHLCEHISPFQVAP